MDALKFLEEKKYENRVLFITDGYRQITLLQILEEYKERILNPKSEAQFKEGDRVRLKNDSTGKRYKVIDYIPGTKKYLLYNPIEEYKSVDYFDVLPYEEA